jgi:hypothetical protein
MGKGAGIKVTQKAQKKKRGKAGKGQGKKHSFVTAKVQAMPTYLFYWKL